MGGGEPPMPVDGASDVPPQQGGMNAGEPPMDAEPPMGNEPMPDGMNDGNGQLDPNMGGEPPMGDDMGMDGMGTGEEGGADDSTESIINQLSDDDREAVRSYAQSLLDRSETAGDDGIGEEEPPMDGEMGGAPQGEQPMMESVIFTKSQLKKINEIFNDKKDEKDNKGNNKMKNKSINKNSPFKGPKFE